MNAGQKQHRGTTTTAGERDEAGVMVGVPPGQSDLFAWWFEHYRRSNVYPLAVADFGMEKPERDIAASIGSVVRLDQMDCGSVTGWFRKPLAIACSPFSQTIWLDVDVEVRGDLGVLFSLCAGSRIGAGEDTFLNARARANGLFRKRLPVEAVLYDSGVLVIEKGSRVLNEWCAMTRRAQPGEFDGDNEILSLFLHRQPGLVRPISKQLHCMRCEGNRPGALVMHWTGQRGKAAIRQTIPLSALSVLRT